MTNLEIRNKYLAENQMSVESLGLSDSDEMMENWLKSNPMPAGDSDDFNFCVNKAMWNLEMEEAMHFFANTNEYNLHTPAYRCNIEQAIINRDSSKSMLFAALEYVENLVENIS